MKKLIGQMMKFGAVGFLCFGIDYGLMIFLTEACRLSYLVSSGISFSVSVIVNYILSLKFVFDTGKDNNKIVEFLIFIVFHSSFLWQIFKKDLHLCWLWYNQQNGVIP